MRVYTVQNNKRSGPHSLEEIQARLEACALSPTDLAWYEGAGDWMPLSQVPGLKMPEQSAPPRLNVPPPLPASASSSRSFAAPPALHSMEPPPRAGLMIAFGGANILLALVLF